jgi:predicted phosphohydrolase
MDIFGGQWENYWERIKEDWSEKVGEDDIVLIAGDISWAMRLEEAVADLKEIAALKGKKIIIRGNHEYWWSSYVKVKSILPESVYAIQNDALKLGGSVFCGTRGWTIPDQNSDEQDVKIYEREKLRLKMTLDAAVKLRTGGEDLYVMTHYPPMNARYEDSGFTEILREYPVTAVIYGHLHGKDIRAEFLVEKDGIKYYLTSCDLVENKLVLVAK